ncbi:hypothetical protein [Bradyrhizobium sp. UFLA05-112]
MTRRRRRFKQTTSLKDRFLIDAQKSRTRADQLPPGKDRDSLLKKAQEFETIAGWATSSGLLAPK